ncbi:DUF4097 family beta strand repeat-containing protein [Paenibacillus donghaensis]|uniref:DUF4097 domain-containing protein n=1 Tax=Paenibacillus donghaensis TaxID=414771 RepID=A0A2Z2K7F5_9BACL|nr:DUF4097 family beta strand repeat-containing protein [Paenibacillus donghaensis]ASA22376.1 hypothetical protein B9T62_17240 [Paenibacillus donghaensis]
MKTNKWIWISMAVVLVVILVIGLQDGSQDFELTEDIPAKEVQSIEINNDSWDLVVRESADNQVHVDIEGNQTDKKKAPVVVTRKSNNLVIQQDKQIGGAFSAFSFHKEGTIKVLIPKNTVEQVRMVNNEGDINIRTLATHNLIVENKAGSVNFNQVEADSGDLNLIEGDLHVKDSSFDRIDVAARGNDLYFKNVTSSVMNLYSKSGEIVLNGVEEKGEMRVETKTGDIQVNYQTAPSSLKVAVENAKGDTTVHLANLSTTEKTDEDVDGIIGTGKNSLYVKSYSGSIGVK